MTRAQLWIKGLIFMMCLGFIFSSSSLLAEEVSVSEAVAEWTPNDGLKVRAKFDFTLPDRFEALLKRGIPLYFTVEFNLKKARRYWWDDDVINAKYEWRLSYHASTRRYRLSRQNLHYSFATLREALTMIRTVRYWTVSENIELNRDDKYNGLIRFRLDENQLPKLLQATPLGSSNWRLDSGWQACRVILSTP